MKEIIRIHLALTPYDVELAAHTFLEDYLEAIKQELHADEDAMREIEARIAELLAERGVAAGRVITMGDVEAIQKQLGDPQAFADDVEETPIVPTQKPRKRLLRDSQHALIGGVCAGIAMYFGVSRAFVRILAVIAVVASFGIMLPIYIVLWFIVPAAETAADRLKMIGEPVTLEALQSESASGKTPTIQPPLLKILRIGFGVLFAIATFLVLAAAALAVGYLIKGFTTDNSPYDIITSMLATGGLVLLAVFCALLTYMLLKGTFRRNLLIALLLTAILGMGSYSTTIIMSSMYNHTFQQRIDRTNETKTETLDLGAKVDGIKTIETRSKGISLTYVVTDEAPSATYSYYTSMVSNPAVKLTRLGDTLVVESSFNVGSFCRGGSVSCPDLSVMVTIKGPAVERVKTDGQVAYEATEQPVLAIDPSSGSSVTLTTVGTLGSLQINATGGVYLYADGAKIDDVKLAAQYGHYTFASLNELAVKQPSTSCGKSMTIRAGHVSTISVNNAPWQQNTKCLDLTIVDRIIAQG